MTGTTNPALRRLPLPEDGDESARGHGDCVLNLRNDERESDGRPVWKPQCELGVLGLDEVPGDDGEGREEAETDGGYSARERDGEVGLRDGDSD